MTTVVLPNTLYKRNWRRRPDIRERLKAQRKGRRAHERGQRAANVPPDCASVDRIDSTKGYIRGNVCIISQRANFLKKDATLAELQALSAYMEGLQP